MSCPRCGVGQESAGGAPTRPRSMGRTRSARDAPRFSRGFKITLAGILGAVLAVGLLPYLFPETEPSPPREPFSGGAPTSPPTLGRGASTADETPAPVPPRTALLENEGAGRPELPTLNAGNATPALLARAKALARERPDDAWLRAYVVHTHFWLARRRQVDGQLQDALKLLDESEPWGAEPGDVASYRAIVYRDDEAWGPAERWARAALAAGSQIDPAEMHHILGRALYFREELPRAIEELETALTLRDAPHIRASLELARRDARASDGFSSRRLSHFIVRYEGETMEGVGRMAIDTLERNHASLTSQLGFQPQEPVSVILYTRRAYDEIAGDHRHLTGGQFDGKIRLPVRGVHWGDEYVRRTLHHELAHAFFHSRTGGSDPRWLNEGLAEYVVGVRTIETGPELAPRLESGGTLEHCLLARLYNCDVFYPASASVVDYLIQTRGMGGIRDVLTLLGEGRNIDDALQRVIGRDERSLLVEWQHFVRRRH